MLPKDSKLEWQFIDGSVVRAHQHSFGAMGNENQGIGKSLGGNTSKTHMAVDAFGFPIEFNLTSSRRSVSDDERSIRLIF